VVRNQLVPICRNSNARITSSNRHESLSVTPVLVSFFSTRAAGVPIQGNAQPLEAARGSLQ
jgi:hypothetical protein